MNHLTIIFAVLVAMMAALSMASPMDWTREPGSPTARRTIKDGVGQQIDHTHNFETGQRTAGSLAKGENARQSSPQRIGQHSTGGEASTSEKTKKKRGKKH